MKKIIASAFLFLGVSTFSLNAQDYVLPLNVRQPQLSSNFGRVRGNRFHAGVDFRTGGVEGVKVFAAADGYIHRIGIKPYGYGKVIYIMHYDGTQTVYAHLSEFTPEVETYVQQARYQRKENQGDYYPPRHMFTVSQGEVIGYSGNTGSSTGPHLHFEIREAVTERTVNPMTGKYFNVPDTTPPEILSVYYYVVDTLSGVPVHTRTSDVRTVRQGKGRYTLEAPLKAPGKGYMQIETIDRKDNVSFGMGVYRITQRIDGRTTFEYVMDGFAFSQTRYAASVSDYALNRRTNNDIYRLSTHDDRKNPFYRNVANRGMIDPSVNKNVEIEVEDDNGNVSTLSFDIVYAPEEYKNTVSIPIDAVPLGHTKQFTHSGDGLTVTVPAGTLFEPVFYGHKKLAASPELKNKDLIILSDFYSINDDNVPLRSNISVAMDTEIPSGYRDKIYLTKINDKGDLAGAFKAVYKEGKVTASISSFGTYVVVADVTAPKITPGFKKDANLADDTYLSFGVKDDISGIASYSAHVDGKWVILEFDTVKGRLIHYFDDRLFGTQRNHTVKLVVTDGAGNRSEYNGEYFH